MLDTIAVYPMRNMVLMISEGPSAGFASFSSPPFVDTKLVRVSPYAAEVVHVDRTAAATAKPATYRIVKLTFEGDTLFAREYPNAPVPLETALVDSIIRSIGERFQNRRYASAPTPARAEELAREGLYTPACHPPVTELLFGRDGTLWLRREDRGTGTVAWNVLSPTGEPWGAVAAPTSLDVLAADRTAVWGREQDALEVPYIVRYRIEADAT